MGWKSFGSCPLVHISGYAQTLQVSEQEAEEKGTQQDGSDAKDIPLLFPVEVIIGQNMFTNTKISVVKLLHPYNFSLIILNINIIRYYQLFRLHHYTCLYNLHGVMDKTVGKTLYYLGITLCRPLFGERGQPSDWSSTIVKL